MLYRNLGKSPLRVSTLCLGTMMFGDQTDRTEAGQIVAHAHAHGVNFIDTADVYTKGASEEMTGSLIKDQRHEWVLATKLGNAMSPRINTSQYSRSWVMQEVEASLRRLQTEFIDIYYLHRDFDGMDLEEPIRALGDLVRSGKIRYWGVSNFRGWRIAEMVRIAAQLGVPQPVVCQPYYNLLNRMPEVEILPACHHYGLGVASYSPIARGVLTGKYAARRGTRPHDTGRPRRQTHHGDRVPPGILGNCAETGPACAGARRHAGPVCHRLGAGQPHPQLRHRRPAHPDAMAGLFPRSRFQVDC